MNIDPPNFSGTYPLAGKQIGPAWRAAWTLLADGQWHSKRDILPVMCEAGTIAGITATNLLRQARRAGVLESRTVKRLDGGADFSDYRIKMEGGS